MKIPKKFNIIDKTIEIILDKELVVKEDHIGWADYRGNKILLDDSDFYKKGQEQAFCHELIHWILWMMESKLEKDEKFVNLFASLLHQVLETME